MRLSRIILLFACTLTLTFEANAQRGKDGDYTVTLPNQVLNTYTSMTANAAVGNTSITVANNAMAGGAFAGNLAPGDLIMIVQMYGATMDAFEYGVYSVPANTIFGTDWTTILEEWGAITAPWGYYNDAGKFEQAEVRSVSGTGTIVLQCGLKNDYLATKRVQIIRIPRFENLTVNAGASIVPTLWNGTSGGVVALEVNTDLTMNAGSSISASEYGFRGGQVDLFGSSGSNVAPQTRFLGSSNPAEGSEKGEGIFGYHAEYDIPAVGRYGIGAPANGGGGGGYENAGGGGGSNIFIGPGTYTGDGTPIGYVAAWNAETAGFGGSTSPGGGRGGYAQARNNQNALVVGPDNTAWGGDARKNNGGRGGHPLTYDPTRLFFGGGGGAGDDNSNQGGAGGRGGGIVYIANYGTTTGTGTISVNGQDGQNANPNNFVINPPAIDRIGIDGAGGGGAGGAIFIENATNLPATITLSSQGGDGGSQTLQYFHVFLTPEADGPGGSGTGGSIAFNSGTPTQQLNAGANGISVALNNTDLVDEFPPNGATTGNNGFGNLPAPYYDITANDVVLCAPGVANLTATILGALPAGYTVQWYNQQFGGVVLASGLNYSPVVAATTTYYVGTCPGTFRIPVTVTILPGAPNLVITDPAAVCAPNTVDITLPAVTAGSDAGTLTYWTDAGATNPLASPTSVGTGIYYIQLDVAGCTAVEAVNVTVSPLPNLVITDPAAVCSPATVDLTAAAVTAGSDAGTLTYWTDPAATVSYGTPATATNGTYYIQLDVAGCTSIEAVNATVNPTPNLVITDPVAVCAPATIDLTVAAVTAGSDAGTLTYWTDPATTVSYATPAAATNGTYYIQLEDGNGCTAVEVVNAMVNSAPNLVITDPAAVCAPNTVNITVPAVTAGSDPGTLTYWTDPAATVSYATPTAATSGTYHIQLEDGNGCTSVEAVNVVVNPQDDASFTMTPTCFGGTASVTGTPGGNWAFNPAPVDVATIDGAGTVANGTTGSTYFVEYTTTGICPASSIQSVTATTDLSYGVTLTAENCGAGDGIIDLVAANGDGGPYQYSITGAGPYSLSGNFTGLTAGNYNISILDNSGCEITSTESLSSTGGPTIDNITPTNPTCAGACDGSITVAVSGGTPPYSYQWFDNLGNPVGIDDATLSNICAGDYDVEVTDASGGTANIFTEDFGVDGGAGCTSAGTSANGYLTANGTWTVVPTGANGTEGSVWYVSTMEEGHIAGECGDGCGATAPNATDRTLHVSSSPFWAGDLGAAYEIGGWCGIIICIEANLRAESPVIDLSAEGGPINLSFDYIMGGQLNVDYAELMYFDGATWTNLLGAGTPLPQTTIGACAPQATWGNYSIALPASAYNNPNVRIGFNWTNNDDGVGDDPSFAVDNLVLTSASAACPAFANTTLVDPAPLDLVITNPAAVCAPATVDLTAAGVTAGSDAGTFTYWTDPAATVSYATPATATNGTYYIQLEDGSGCTTIEAVNVTVNPAPNLVITDPAAACSPATVDLTAAAVTVGSDPGALTYWTDPAATVVLASPNAVATTGTYYIQLEGGNGCTSIEEVDVVVTSTPNLTITDPADVCSPATVDITLPAVTAGSDAGTLTYWTDPAATVSFGTPTTAGNGTYYIQLDIGGGCTTVEAVNVTVNPLPNLVVTDPAAVCAPGTIDLTVAAVTAGSDAGTLTYWTDPAATVSYATPATATNGTYYIQLEDGNGCTAIEQVNATVNPAPNLVITDPAAACSPATVDLTVAAVTAGSDAGTLTYWTDPAATVVLATPNAVGTTGTYYIQLEDGNGCISVAAVDVVVTSTPNLVITDPAGVCAPATVDITVPAVTAGSDAGTLTYWTDPAATVSFGTPTTATNGTYYIQLDLGGGCSTVESVNVTVNPLPNLVVTDPAAVCAPATVDLTAAGVTAGSDAGTLTYWTDPAATVSYATPATATDGTYYIQLEDGNGCISVEAVNATVNAQPAVTATNDGPACAGGGFNLDETGGDAIGWFWSTGGGAVITTATDQSPSVTGAADGDVFTVIVADANGCTNTGNTTISIVPGPSLDPIADVTVCDSYVLPAITGTDLTGGEAYYNNSQLAGGTVISGTLTTSQTVWVFDGSGACNDEISFVLTVNPSPTVVSTSGSGTYCTGDVPGDVLVQVSGTGPWTLDYTLNGAPQSANSATNTINLGNATGVYVLNTLTDASCSDAVSGTVTIVVNPTPPTPVASEDGTYCLGEFVPSMTVVGTGGTYNWYLDETLNSSIGIGSSHAPSDFIGTSVYYVTETVGGCQSAPDSVLITIENCDVIYPSAFTPDGDLSNDTWELPGLDESYPNNIVRIYNRWGNLLFEHISSVTNPYNLNQWDGTYKGKALPVASYYYIIDLNNENQDKVSGTVTIILNE